MKEVNIIILVGTNPLPCYLAAWQLISSLREGYSSHLWLVPSMNNPDIGQEGTIAQADHVRQVLERTGVIHAGTAKTIPLSDAGSPFTIRKEIGDAIERIQPSGPGEPVAIHVDYTGGTKSMGVSVAQVAKDFSDTAAFTFSYLDARRSMLVFDAADPSLYKGRFDVPSTGYTMDLRGTIDLSIDDLLALHDIEAGQSPVYDFPLEDQELRRLINDGVIEKFIIVIKQKLRKLYGGSNSSKPKWEKYAKNAQEYLSLSENGVNDFVIPDEELRSFFIGDEMRMLVKQQLDGKLTFRSTFDVGISAKEMKQLFEYLDGHWLENYVYGVCQEIKADMGGHADLRKGVNCRSRSAKKSKDNHSDIDIMFVRGYQLTAISVTTSSERRICKGKGFEVMLRAAQIGGEESRSVLVTNLSHNEVESLQEDLRTFTGSLPGQLKILGRDDWPSSILKTQLKKYILS